MLVPVLLPLLTGCLQMEHTLDILPDGTLSYALTYAISEQAVTQFREAARIRDDLAEIQGETPPPVQDPILLAFQDPTDKRIRVALEPLEADGLIQIDELELDNRNNWRNVKLRISCANPARLTTNSFFQTHGFSLTETDPKTWLFWRAPHLTGAAPPPPDTRTVRQATPLLESFKTKVSVTVPGRITQTSADKTVRTTSTWTFDFDRNGGALLDLQYKPFRIAFEPTTRTSLIPVTYEGRSLVPAPQR